jgi:hypothetical protein
VLIDVSARKADSPPAALIAFVKMARAWSVDRTEGELATVLSILVREADWAPALIGATRRAISTLLDVCMPHDCSSSEAGANIL